MKIYVASAFQDFERTRAVQALARRRYHEITFDWTQEVGKVESGAESPDYARECAEKDFMGVIHADVVIVLTPIATRKDLGCGLWVELGVAVAQGVPAVVAGEQRERTIFTRLRGVSLVASDEETVVEAERVFKELGGAG